jgi:hypothetical protein
MRTITMPARLSLLWVFIMFNMVFADIISFIYPGALQEILTGYAGSIHVTPGFLLAAAVVTEIPIAMIVLSRVLKHGVNRWLNIAAAVVTVAYIFGGGSLDQVHYLFFAAMQLAAALLIVWSAWTWRVPAASVLPAVAVETESR